VCWRLQPRAPSLNLQPWQVLVGATVYGCCLASAAGQQQTDLPFSCPKVLSANQKSALSGYKWVLVKDGQQLQSSAVPVPDGSEAPTVARAAAQPEYLAGAGPEGGAGSEPLLERLREALRHRDDQLASLRDQLRQLEGTRDRCPQRHASSLYFAKCFDWQANCVPTRIEKTVTLR